MKKYLRAKWILLAAATILYTGSCKKVEIVTTTTTDVNIYTYLVQHPDKFSDLVKIVDKSGYSGFLDAYGAYTCFAPSNDAVQNYLHDAGKNSVDQLTEDEAKNIVKLHLIQDTIGTTEFKDGKLPSVTMYGQYLLTGVVNNGGTSSYIINRLALVTQSNIYAANGIIHVIDHVLKPATLTMAKMIEANPDYSIFTQALKETGYYDTLNIENNPDTTRRFLTVMAETNKALQDSGITTYAQLKAKYCQTGDPKNAADSLHLYCAYHILFGAKYLADIITAPSHVTLAPLEVVTSKLSEQTVLINDIDFNGAHEQGIVLDRPGSDNGATNGVVHKATSHFTIKIRKPAPVYWDLGDFPEIRKLPAYFRKLSYTFAFGTIQDYTWEKNTISYNYNTASNFPCFWNDCVQIPLGTAAARNLWVQLRTPLLVKGRYKVWICYRQQAQSSSSTNNPIQVYFDGQPLPRLIDCSSGSVPAGTEGEREALGWKIYSDINQNTMSGRLVGTVDVAITDRHLIKMQGTTGGQNTNNFDMIHFIPVTMPQTRPLFNRTGILVP